MGSQAACATAGRLAGWVRECTGVARPSGSGYERAVFKHVSPGELHGDLGPVGPGALRRIDFSPEGAQCDSLGQRPRLTRDTIKKVSSPEGAQCELGGVAPADALRPFRAQKKKPWGRRSPGALPQAIAFRPFRAWVNRHHSEHDAPPSRCAADLSRGERCSEACPPVRDSMMTRSRNALR